MCMCFSILGSGAFALEKSTKDDEVITPMYITVEVTRSVNYGYLADPSSFVPPSSVYWTENGLSGTLYLQYYVTVSKDTVTAIYKGTLLGQP